MFQISKLTIRLLIYKLNFYYYRYALTAEYPKYEYNSAPWSVNLFLKAVQLMPTKVMDKIIEKDIQIKVLNWAKS